MFDFPVDCLVGEIVSVDHKKNDVNEVIFHIDNYYGDHSIYGKSESSFISGIFKNSEIKFFYKILNNVYQYYIREFDPELEVSFYKEDANNLLTYFNELKLVKDGIVFEIGGTIGQNIFESYGKAKFAGFVFMNFNLHKCMESKTFNNINMDCAIKQNIASQNIFNLLIPIGNLKRSSLILKNATNIFM